MQPERHEIELTVNGASCRRAVEARMLLSDFLRHDLLLAGTHVGCEHGVCGACTVLLDGAVVRGCLVLAVQCDGAAVETIEGMSDSGASTVLLDGAPVRSCLMLAVQANGHELATVEGLAAGDDLHPIQKAMHQHHGLQCGYCTPGILMTMTVFLSENPQPSEDEVREALSGNLCRCTGYQNIVDAMMAAATAMDSAAP
jgi:3-oxo-Delta1-steroid hydratase/dehydrogenase small subunit